MFLTYYLLPFTVFLTIIIHAITRTGKRKVLIIFTNGILSKTIYCLYIIIILAAIFLVILLFRNEVIMNGVSFIRNYSRLFEILIRINIFLGFSVLVLSIIKRRVTLMSLLILVLLHSINLALVLEKIFYVNNLNGIANAFRQSEMSSRFIAILSVCLILSLLISIYTFMSLRSSD